jgi:hypothetical protein
MTDRYRGPITTALQFMASFRSVRVLSTGCAVNLCWVEILADEDGTEEQHYFIMEFRAAAGTQLKVMQNLSSVELHQAKCEPAQFWRRAHTPQHGDDSAW